MATTSDVFARSGLLAAFLLVSVAYAQKAMSASGPVDCDAEFTRLVEDTRTYPDLAIWDQEVTISIAFPERLFVNQSSD